jgi:hypothetical protein
MSAYALLQEAQEQRPNILSIFWNGQQILRIENGETVLELPVYPGGGLLTIHFDDDPDPIYYAALPT